MNNSYRNFSAQNPVREKRNIINDTRNKKLNKLNLFLFWKNFSLK